MINLKGAMISAEIDGVRKPIGTVMNYIPDPVARSGPIVIAATGKIEFMIGRSTRYFLIDPAYPARVLTLRRQMRLKGRPGWKRSKPGRGTWALSLNDTVEVMAPHHSGYRFRRVRIAPCPNRNDPLCHHEVCVVDGCGDDGVYVCCTCGWTGPTATSEEQAVRLHNAKAGMGYIPITPWIVHRPRKKWPGPSGQIGEDDDLPF